MSNSEDARVRLGSAIESLKQLKSVCSDANVSMDIASGVLKRLEDENEQLRGELDDLRDTAEGFEPDVYIKLPLDAGGVPVRPGDTVYGEGGREYLVNSITIRRGGDISAFVIPNDEKGFATYEQPSRFTHSKPDSWEQLAHDAKLGSINYAEKRGITVGPNDYKNLIEQKGTDIVKRAKKLAGVAE